MNIYIIVAVIALTVGGITAVYLKGEKSCSNSYEVKILKAKLKNQEIALAYYKRSKAAAEEIAKEAEIKSIETGKLVEDLQYEVGKLSNTTIVCIPDNFLSKLRRIRQQSESTNTKSTR